jgi:hypothetical protein
MSRRALFLALTVVSAGLITFLASSPPADAILLQGTFIDDNDSVHQNGIEAIAAAGITVGCNPPTNDRFCPNDSVSRAQAATFLARALSLSDDGNDYFVDDNGHVLEGGINRVAAAGITAGCNPPDNDRFCPDRALTRAQFAAFITRALGLAHTSVDYFDDDNGHVLENAINAIAEEGITEGCNPPTNNRFCPNQTLTRAQLATLLTRALSLPHNPQRIPLTSWNPISCSKDGVRCSVNIETFSGRTHWVEEGLFQRLPYGPGDESEFLGANTRFTLNLNGSQVALSEKALSATSTQVTRLWNTTLVFTQGSHVLVGEWRRNGRLIQRTTAVLDVR